MKKLIAILLLVIYLFNLGGYSLVFHYFMHRSEQQFVQQIDQNNYQDTELLQISIPLHLPYMQNSSSFERVDGSVQKDGIDYNYVKRRIYNDTLYVLCLPNQQKAQIAKGKTSYAGEVNDFASNKKQKEPVSKKAGPTAEYNNSIPRYSFVLSAVTATTPNHGLLYTLCNTLIALPERPPQPVC